MADSFKTIRLNKYVADPVLSGNQHVWPLTIVAHGVNMPDEIFVYSVNKDFEGDIFRNVASVHDIYEFPKTDAVHTDGDFHIPFYRRNEVNFMLRYPEEIDQIWTRVQEDVQELVENYALDDNLKSAGSVEITVQSNNKEAVSIPSNDYSEIITLSPFPSGDLSVDAKGNVIVTAPFTFTTAGWLPPAEAPNLGLGTIDTSVELFYNIAADNNLKQFFPGLKPNQISLKLNGKELPFGTVWDVVDETLVWKKFSETVAKGLGLSTNLPWTKDYVDVNNPGDNPNEIVAYVNL